MSTGKERINVFRDTLRWVETNPKLNKAVEKAKRKTKIFYDNDYPVFDASRLRGLQERPEGGGKRLADSAFRVPEGVRKGGVRGVLHG